MRLWPRRSRPVPPEPRADHVQIDVMEYELFGIEPKPGTMAAAVIGLRQLGAVLRNDAPEEGPE